MTKGKTNVRRILCSDTGHKCDARFEGQDDNMLVAKAVEHLAQYHNASLSPQLATQVRQLIRPI
jgi:predicted small metal-binding protein